MIVTNLLALMRAWAEFAGAGIFNCACLNWDFDDLRDNPDFESSESCQSKKIPVQTVFSLDEMKNCRGRDPVGMTTLEHGNEKTRKNGYFGLMVFERRTGRENYFYLRERGQLSGFEKMQKFNTNCLL